jgi:hypothetical protein
MVNAPAHNTFDGRLVRRQLFGFLVGQNITNLLYVSEKKKFAFSYTERKKGASGRDEKLFEIGFIKQKIINQRIVFDKEKVASF